MRDRGKPFQMSSHHYHEEPNECQWSLDLNGILAVIFRLLKNNKKTFEWIDDCEEAFRELKEYLVTPPILTCLELEKVLYIYLATLDKAVSSMLVEKEVNK